ncbi:phosphatidate cytidylyltransferase [Devosia crocina]|uniref:Phosphatidate cytidylyltransferase n=1 Tax=Devosia crocina TaxID=429728 RepID=A0A1I7NCN0_9HYPH|nr:phosphatidate cytidylyltransferase [Devosia crocina]SFV32428.1 phosphatidate cytidylyltransferase [Devosia crocina]
MTEQGTPPPAPSSPPRRNWADVGPRIVSAFVLILVTATALYLGSYFFSAVVGAVYAGAYREWETMISRAPLGNIGMILVGLVALSGLLFPLLGPLSSVLCIGLACLLSIRLGREALVWRIAGLLIFGTLIGAAVTMRGDGVAGIWAGLLLGTVVWMTDSAAFFTGRQIGGEKLAPGISPSKTWSGALGGLALGSVAGLVVWTLLTDSPWGIGLMIVVSISILGQLGDLAESAVKRHFHIKDSGHIIPGHGGLMDRLDSLTLGIIFVLIVGGLHGGFGAVAEGLLYW